MNAGSFFFMFFHLLKRGFWCAALLALPLSAFAQEAAPEASGEKSAAVEEAKSALPNIPAEETYEEVIISDEGENSDPEIEAMLEKSSEEHRRQELGVNPITIPSIRELLETLDKFRPVPIEKINSGNREAVFSNRLQTSVYFGSLIADGFMLAIAERSADVENIGKALIRQSHNLGIGERLTSRSKSILDKSQLGDWIGLREELIQTQAEVEQSMMDLRDEEMVHMISFGGWLRGFQLGATAIRDNYFQERATVLIQPEVVEYFIDRLDTLHPRLRKTQMVNQTIEQMQALYEFMNSRSGKAPSKEDVSKLLDMGNKIYETVLSRVNEKGEIIGPPQP
ncbi:MAG: hypothetical protein ACK5NG_04740 [Chthoniobacterales bacterium]